MNVRLLENWLSSASERCFQIPFCHTLVAEGHKVLHLSRHCGMELGKDVLSVDDNGKGHAYQLKSVASGRMNLSAWRRDVERQITELVMMHPDHPGFPPGPHRSHLVINGVLEEEVSSAIQAFNRSIQRMRPYRKLEVMVRGDLLDRFRRLGSDFWPTELVEVKLFLECYLDEGNGPVPKKRLSELLSSILKLGETDKVPRRDECKRRLAAATVIFASSLSGYSRSNNHAAQFEAWTLFFAYALALAERRRLSLSAFMGHLHIAREAMFLALENLFDEAIESDGCRVGDIWADKFVERARITYLMALFSLYGLWIARREGGTERHEAVRQWCAKHRQGLHLWGEAAIPQFLSTYFFWRKTDATMVPDLFLEHVLNTVARSNGPRSDSALATPYYEAEDILPRQIKLETDELCDSFRGESYTLETLLHIFARLNYRQKTTMLWPDVSRVRFCSFEPDHPWQRYMWRCPSGRTTDRVVPRTQSWRALRNLSEESVGSDVPKLFKQFPIEYLAFLIVFPHRLNASGGRWLSSQISGD
jgi:hypothetical protein